MRRVLLLAAPLALAGCAAGTHTATRTPPPTRTGGGQRKLRPTRLLSRPSPAQHAFGLPPVRRGPVPGYLLIADRNNNRLLLVSPSKRIEWRFPGPSAPYGSFRDPDDAFFTPGYGQIVVNQEFNETVVRISPKAHRIVWSYGRPGVAGSGSGELSNPDDAYVLPSGDVRVADIQNCRVVKLSPSHHIVGEIGTAGACAHDPPRTLLSPNGDTPLPDGGMLVTEIGGYVDRFDARGRLVYSLRTPTSYPSDAQLLPNGNILVAGFYTPGRIDELTPAGRVVWTYGPTSGPGSLDRPSLAVRWPNGMIAATDDWHHRIVVIDPRTKRIVWQYGHFGIASSAPGYLSKPDGLDLLPAPQTTVVHHAHVGPTRRAAPQVSVRRVGSLPQATSRMAATALPDGRVVAGGGLVSGGSSTQILAGPPTALRVAGTLPTPTHDAAAAAVDGYVYVFGGGTASSTDRISRIDPRTWRSSRAGSIGEPLSDLGAAVVGGTGYLVGGYTGTQFATAILRFRPGIGLPVATRLPQGLRYAGVAAIGGTIYVAGGLTTGGESRSVYAVDPVGHTVRRIARLPQPLAHAPMAAAGGKLYLIGGTSSAGAPSAAILSIDPSSGRVGRAGQLPHPLADAAAVSIGGSVYVLGGAGSSPSRAVLRLTP